MARKEMSKEANSYICGLITGTVIGISIGIFICGITETLSKKKSPYIFYNATTDYLSDNVTIDIDDNHSLNQGHAYDKIETEDGYDITFHFVKGE